MASAFTISLDFELMWGVRDKRSLEEYGPNILAARAAIPEMLALFKKYEIRVTWSTVGLLFAETKDEMLKYFPIKDAQYTNQKYSVKEYLQESVGQNEQDDPYHFAGSLIEKIKNTPYQELSTHTYTHYYCLEEGQTPEEFSSDLEAAVKLSRIRGVDLKSIVFPRNQVCESYLAKLNKHGIMMYRGNLDTLLRREKSQQKRSLIVRFLRLLDTVFCIDGHHSVRILEGNVKNLPASRFLRPIRSSKLPGYKLLKQLQLRRIKQEMTYAAKNGEIYHLWWHPHNFGQMTEKNLDKLEDILKHYKYLESKYNMQSMNMSDFL